MHHSTGSNQETSDNKLAEKDVPAKSESAGVDDVTKAENDVEMIEDGDTEKPASDAGTRDKKESHVEKSEDQSKDDPDRLDLEEIMEADDS